MCHTVRSEWGVFVFLLYRLDRLPKYVNCERRVGNVPIYASVQFHMQVYKGEIGRQVILYLRPGPHMYCSMSLHVTQMHISDTKVESVPQYMWYRPIVIFSNHQINMVDM